MHTIDLQGIDTTVQKTNEWLKEIMVTLGVDDGVAYRTLRAVLHALRDRLSIDEAVQLGAQLPMLIRGLYYEGWCPRRTPTKANRAQFIEQVRSSDCWRPGQLHPELFVRAVLSVLTRHISAGEVNDIQAILPTEFRELWPAPAVTRAASQR
jgi:uncharacterized protein (DUF2267 family)